MTDVELELVTEHRILELFDRQKRGGISAVGSIPYCKANNKYCPDYNKNEPSTYLFYLDATNLYGKAMSMSLPIGNFEYIDMKDYNLDEWKNIIMNYDIDSEIGYVLDCDINIPEELK